MEFRIIDLPPFKAASSGLDSNADFSEQGVLGQFDAYFSQLVSDPRDSFVPRDYLCFDGKRGGMFWLYALTDEQDAGDFEVVDFEGGLFLTYVYEDGDEAASQRLFNEAKKYIESLTYLELDISEKRLMMGHIITPQEIIKKQGWAQMESFIPVKLLNN